MFFFHSRLPYWIQAVCPKVFYITEKAWNYYPFTITEYTVKSTALRLFELVNTILFHFSVPLYLSFISTFKQDTKTTTAQPKT